MTKLQHTTNRSRQNRANKKHPSPWVFLLFILSTFGIGFFSVAFITGNVFAVSRHIQTHTVMPMLNSVSDLVLLSESDGTTMQSRAGSLPVSLNTINEEPVATVHISTPTIVRGLYMTSWVAGTPWIRSEVIQEIEKNHLNTIIIDIKDETGKVSYQGSNQIIRDYNAYSNKIRNIRELVSSLHDKGIYVIARLAVFQDPNLANNFPKLAVLTQSGEIWRDRKGISWVDASSTVVWDYTVEIAQEAYGLGFDEINLDYVRFPTDGNLTNMVLPNIGNRSRQQVMKDFFAYMDNELRTKRNIPLSADVFGLTTTAEGSADLGIGQVFTDIAPHVDYICPMIYPSHYAPGSFGVSNPAANPYIVIKSASKGALGKLEEIGESPKKYRPWIQDFDLGANYTAAVIREQIRALHELGVGSWLVWGPTNRYTKGAYAKYSLPKLELPIEQTQTDTSIPTQ